MIWAGKRLRKNAVARKVRPKELEVDSRDTYTAQYGIGGTSVLLIFLAVMIMGLDLYFVKTIYGKISLVQLLPLLVMLFFYYSVGCFFRKPDVKSAKGTFYAAILFIFITDIAFVAQFFIRKL